MSTDLQNVTENLPAIPSEQLPEELQLVAFSKQQMQSAQQQLLAWCERKIADAQAKLQEASDAKTSALANNFNTKNFHRVWLRAKKEVEFYEKMLGAIEAGYTIIPNLPLDMFAIRTCRSNPLRKESDWRGSGFRQHSESPPQGEGEYVDSVPEVRSYEYDQTNSKTGLTEIKQSFYASAFSDAIDFPLSIAKPVIMDRTAEAMQHKVFDEIGVLPRRWEKKDDPIVAGVIKKPGGRQVTFLIAWYVDTSVL